MLVRFGISMRLSTHAYLRTNKHGTWVLLYLVTLLRKGDHVPGEFGQSGLKGSFA